MPAFPDSLRTSRDGTELLERTAEHFDAQTATLHMLDDSDGLLHLRAAVGSLPAPVLEAVRTVPVGKGIAGLTVERGEPVDLCNLQTDRSGVARPGARETGVGGSVCVPVLRDGRPVGALGVGTAYEHVFSDEEIALLCRAAERAAALA